MRLLFLGDLYAKPGRNMVIKTLPRLIDRWEIDFVVANAENSAHGFGMTKKIVESLFSVGVDVITSGNHAYDNDNIRLWLDDEPRVLRPYNWSPPQELMGQAFIIVKKSNYQLLVLNLAGQIFMQEKASSPFDAADEVLGQYPLQSKVTASLIDIHAEATSEKQGLGHHVDGRASMVVGTHVHIPTADARILAGGTAYQTDAGMCGVYDSVIGVAKEASLSRLRHTTPKQPFRPAEGIATLCGVLSEIDPQTGLATHISPVRIGGDLMPIEPYWLSCEA